jgi:hypothetical protein
MANFPCCIAPLGQTALYCPIVMPLMRRNLRQVLYHKVYGLPWAVTGQENYTNQAAAFYPISVVQIPFRNIDSSCFAGMGLK